MNKRYCVGFDGANKKFMLAPRVPLLNKIPSLACFCRFLVIFQFSLPVNLGLRGEGEEGFALGNSCNKALLGGFVMSPV